MFRALVLVTTTLLVACGGFEGSATQKLDLKDSDIASGTIAAEHELDSANSTWDNFLKDAKADLGEDPTELSVDTVKITFDAAKAKNTGKYEDALKGDVVVSFRIKDTNEIIDIATVKDPTGNGTIELDVTNSDLSAKRDKLKGGAFKVGVRASTARAKGDDFTLPIIVTFGLTAK